MRTQPLIFPFLETTCVVLFPALGPGPNFGPLKSWAGPDIYRPRPHNVMGRPSPAPAPAPLVFEPVKYSAGRPLVSVSGP